MRKKLFNRNTNRWVYSDGASAREYLHSLNAPGFSLVPHFADPQTFLVVQLSDGTCVPTPPPPSMKLFSGEQVNPTVLQTGDGHGDNDMSRCAADALPEVPRPKVKRRVTFIEGTKVYDGLSPHADLIRNVGELLLPFNRNFGAEEGKIRRTIACRTMRYAFRLHPDVYSALNEELHNIVARSRRLEGGGGVLFSTRFLCDAFFDPTHPYDRKTLSWLFRASAKAKEAAMNMRSAPSHDKLKRVANERAHIKHSGLDHDHAVVRNTSENAHP